MGNGFTTFAPLEAEGASDTAFIGAPTIQVVEDASAGHVDLAQQRLLGRPSAGQCPSPRRQRPRPERVPPRRRLPLPRRLALDRHPLLSLAVVRQGADDTLPAMYEGAR